MTLLFNFTYGKVEMYNIMTRATRKQNSHRGKLERVLNTIIERVIFKETKDKVEGSIRDEGIINCLKKGLKGTYGNNKLST